MVNNKKGISAIVATLMIILLAIVAFGMVSVFVKNIVSKNVESADLSSKCLEASIEAIRVINVSTITEPDQYNITLSRSGAGDFDINGVDLIFEDSTGQSNEIKTINKQNIGPLSKFTETVTLSLVPVKVKVVPWFLTEAGKKHPCDNAQSLNI